MSFQKQSFLLISKRLAQVSEKKNLQHSLGVVGL